MRLLQELEQTDLTEGTRPKRTGMKSGLAIKLPRAQSPAPSPQGATLMVFISIPRMHGWGNRDIGSCTSSLRINAGDSSVDCHKV
jgi:hypothetical protein